MVGFDDILPGQLVSSAAHHGPPAHGPDRGAGLRPAAGPDRRPQPEPEGGDCCRPSSCSAPAAAARPAPRGDCRCTRSAAAPPRPPITSRLQHPTQPASQAQEPGPGHPGHRLIRDAMPDARPALAPAAPRASSPSEARTRARRAHDPRELGAGDGLHHPPPGLLPGRGLGGAHGQLLPPARHAGQRRPGHHVQVPQPPALGLQGAGGHARRRPPRLAVAPVRDLPQRHRAPQLRHRRGRVPGPGQHAAGPDDPVDADPGRHRDRDRLLPGHRAGHRGGLAARRLARPAAARPDVPPGDPVLLPRADPARAAGRASCTCSRSARATRTA